MRILLGLVLCLILLYGAAVGTLYVRQASYVFAPGRGIASPAVAGLPQAKPVTIRAADGVELLAWFIQAAPGHPTILYFHGNAGSIADRAGRFAEIAASGDGVLALSYRGYPGSGGKPSEKAFLADGLRVFDWLRERTPDVALHGESLGTAIATYVAAHREVRALVLEAPFTAISDIGAELFPWAPVALLLRDQFRSREWIKGVKAPVMVAQGTQDLVVPPAQGRRLYELANPPKRMLVIQGGGHADLWTHGLWKDELTFLEAAESGTLAGSSETDR
ncbi:hypothetical protein SAMN05216548_10128 [Faunimonas pinastri]|uniref:AB hydrolase-1 domain-containing protein n=1 Tax=Faunimonas pinastri TaxID=1855383 RepID=A0A1H8Z5V6_9HYPH|nr:alpha/beta hydrolase [Faunimonas pinastri]SEP58988.1 hypothetical protein SAMN05216548_10128 [Faunimonas pinastri]